MSKVIETCELLAREIAECPEYLAVKTAEAAVQEDAAALALVLEYRQKYQRMTALFGRQDEEPEAFREAARDLAECEDQMREHPAVRAMMEAQSAFSAILGQINAILQNAVGIAQGGGCSGDCSGCGGCNN